MIIGKLSINTEIKFKHLNVFIIVFKLQTYPLESYEQQIMSQKLPSVNTINNYSLRSTNLPSK